MPFHPVPPAADQEPQPVLEPVEQLRRNECARACGGELDGQRNPVEATADLRHLLPPVGEVEVRVEGEGTLREQLGAGSCGVQRRQRDELLGADRQRLPGGGQYPDARAVLDESLTGRSGALDDVLAVVEDQQGLPPPQRPCDGLHGLLAGSLGECECLQHGPGDIVVARLVREVHQVQRGHERGLPTSSRTAQGAAGQGVGQQEWPDLRGRHHLPHTRAFPEIAMVILCPHALPERFSEWDHGAEWVRRPDAGPSRPAAPSKNS